MMKYSAAIIITLAVSICQIDHLLLKTRDIRSSVHSLEIHIWRRVGGKMREFEGNFQSEMTRLIDGAFDDAASSQRAVKMCKKALQPKFDQAYKTYWASRGECEIRASTDWSVTLGAARLANEGKELDREIENIRSKCYHRDLGAFEQCLEPYLPEVTLSVKYYEANYNAMMSHMDVTTVHGPFAGSNHLYDCLIDSRGTFRDDIEILRNEGVKCARLQDYEFRRRFIDSMGFK